MLAPQVVVVLHATNMHPINLHRRNLAFVERPMAETAMVEARSAKNARSNPVMVVVVVVVAVANPSCRSCEISATCSSEVY